MVMLLAGVLFAAGMMILQFSTQQQWLLQSTFQQGSDFNRVYTQIQLDAFRAKKWEWKGYRSIRLQSDQRVVEYKFETDQIVRSDIGQSGTIKDVFPVGVKMMDAYLGDVSIKRSGQHVDLLQLEFNPPNQSFSLSVHKDYGMINSFDPR